MKTTHTTYEQARLGGIDAEFDYFQPILEHAAKGALESACEDRRPAKIWLEGKSIVVSTRTRRPRGRLPLYTVAPGPIPTVDMAELRANLYTMLAERRIRENPAPAMSMAERWNLENPTG